MERETCYKKKRRANIIWNRQMTKLVVNPNPDATYVSKMVKINARNMARALWGRSLEPCQYRGRIVRSLVFVFVKRS
jgi:hypothetical protein